MRRLRVAYLPASLRPGGAERQMLALAERLPQDRFKIEFVAIAGPGEYDAQAIFTDLLSEFVAEQFRPALLPAVRGRNILLNNGVARRSHPRLHGNRLAATYGSLR